MSQTTVCQVKLWHQNNWGHSEGEIFEEIIAENSPNIGKETVILFQEAQSSRKGKPKEEQAETCSNQNDKN